MNSEQLGSEPSVFLYAAYVAFAFSCMLFGALVFRQVLDNMAVRSLNMGEDRDGFIDARAVVFLCSFLVVSAVTSVVIGATARETIFSHALPMILFLQVLQLTLRAFLQRTLVKTKGIVVRSVLFDHTKSALFEEIVMVRFVRSGLWVSVCVSLPSEQITFRIFLFSAEQLQRMIASSCAAPILWLSDHFEHKTHPPTTSV